MKLRLFMLVVLLAVVSIVGSWNIHAAWMLLFAGSAVLAPWGNGLNPVFRQNIISSDLDITRVLENAIIGLRDTLMPLGTFSTVWKDPQMGYENGKPVVSVPVYEFSRGDVKDRVPGESYKSKVSNTSTKARRVIVDKEKVVGISFNNEEEARQVAFDPVMHGYIKGQDLAHTVLEDIFGIITHGRFNGRSIAPVAASAFDADDVADLAQICMEDNWGQNPRPGLILNPAAHFRLARQSAILDASASGSTSAIRDGVIRNILGFNESPTGALLANNGASKAFTAATTDICTSTAHGYLTGDQVTVVSDTALPTGLSASTYYYIIRLSDDTFKLASSLVNALAGTAVDITAAGSGNHSIALRTNMLGFAGHPSALITAFAPVRPTAGIRQKLVNFELVDDPLTGLTLEYRHIADEDAGEEYQLIGCRYGKQYGLESALKIISAPANVTL